MTVQKVLIWPDKRLIRPSEPVIKFDERLVQLVIDLHHTMMEFDKNPNFPDAAGLAAPQIGIHKQVFVYRLDGKETCMINPVILEEEGKQSEQEGCLSFPGVFVRVPRTDKILVEFQDVDGNKNRLRTDGFLSRVVQHELDHLKGQVFIAGLSQVKRDLVTRKMKKVGKRIK